MLLAQKRPSLVNRRHVDASRLKPFGATGPVTARVFGMWRKFVQRYTRRFNARLQGMTPLRITFGVTHDHHQRFFACRDGFMPGLKIAFVHPGVPINRTAGSGTKGQTIGTLFNQQVIEIAFACGTAPVAVTDAAPTASSIKSHPCR